MIIKVAQLITPVAGFVQSYWSLHPNALRVNVRQHPSLPNATFVEIPLDIQLKGRFSGEFL